MQVENDTGFTLLETLIALVIASASLVIIIQSFAGGFKTQSKLKSQYEMARLAEGKLDEIEVLLEIDPQSETGTFQDKYAWTVNYRPYQLEEQENLNPYWVEIKVTIIDPEISANEFRLERLMIVGEASQ